jgi:uncharacterized protein (DUF736 family)
MADAPKKPNQGYLNSNKKASDKHPDFRAEIPVDARFIKGLADSAAAGGAVIYMAGWKGVSQRNGEPYVFLRLDSTKYQAPARHDQPDRGSSDDVPF